MRFAAVQHDIDWERPPSTRRRILALLADLDLLSDRNAKTDQPGFLLLPELCETGFSLDLDAIADLRDEGRSSVEWAAEVARRTNSFVQIGHAVRATDGRGLNRATILAPDGGELEHYDKIHPFSFAGEDRIYASGRRAVVLDCGDFKVCPLICYDLRFPELWRHAVRRGAEVFTIGASWPAKRQRHWRSLLVARAIENQAYVVACNRVGRDPSHEYAGGSMIISPMGDVLAEGGVADAMVTATLERDELLAWRRTFPALADLQARWLGDLDEGRR